MRAEKKVLWFQACLPMRDHNIFVQIPLNADIEEP